MKKNGSKDAPVSTSGARDMGKTNHPRTSLRLESRPPVQKVVDALEKKGAYKAAIERQTRSNGGVPAKKVSKKK